MWPVLRHVAMHRLRMRRVSSVGRREGSSMEQSSPADRHRADKTDQLRDMIEATRERVQRSRDLVSRIERQQKAGRTRG